MFKFIHANIQTMGKDSLTQGNMTLCVCAINIQCWGFLGKISVGLDPTCCRHNGSTFLVFSFSASIPEVEMLYHIDILLFTCANFIPVLTPLVTSNVHFFVMI